MLKTLDEKAFDFRVKAGYTVAFVLLLLSYIFTLYSNSQLKKQTGWINHTNKVIKTLDGLVSGIKDAETGLRGYINTKDSSFLVPYKNSFAIVNTAFSDLKADTKDNDLLQKHLQTLTPLITKRYDELAFAMNYYPKNNYVVTETLLRSFYTGRSTMDSIRFTVNAMQKQVQYLLDIRTKELDSKYRAANIIIIISLALALVFALVGFYTYRRENKARLLADKRGDESDKRSNESDKRSDIADKRSDESDKRSDESDKRSDIADKRSDESDKRSDESDKRSDIADKRSEESDKRSDIADKRSEESDKRSNESDRRSNESDRRSDESDKRSDIADKRSDESDKRSDESDRRSDESDKRSDIADKRGDIADKRGDYFLKQLQQRVVELDKANKEIILMKRSEKFAATGRIARTIAHEVRNPLTNIDLAVAQIKSDMVAQDESSNMLFDMVTRNSHRINQLISELLSATRFAELSYISASINTLLDEVLDMAKDRIGLNRIKIEKKYGKDICNIMVDPGKIKIAFLNLIVNAIEAMEPDKGVLQITTKEEDGKCVVEITDNGHGMAEEELNKLFEPYFTTKTNGNGLGLTNTQNIILNHKGYISVNSKPGEGTSFVIKFDFATPA